ncbi:hypothetical protein MMC30_008771 [Trapelia coarctata]|nr:hypothetical protein [Trapelia coarctata]
MSASVASWFGGPSTSSSHQRRTSSPKRRSHSPAGSTISKVYITRTHSPSGSTRGAFVRPHSPSGRAPSPTRSTTSTSRSYFFSRPHTSSTSKYKRGPRDGYIARLVHTIKRLLRDLIRYAKENPMKMFTLVVLPLITGGALTKLLSSVGIRLPAGLAALAGGMGRGGGGGGMVDALGGIAGGVGGGGVQTALGIAKMFM